MLFLLLIHLLTISTNFTPFPEQMLKIAFVLRYILGLYEILGPDYIPDLDQTDTDKDGIIDYFDQDDDDDGIPDWEDDELNSNTSIPGISSLAVISLLGLVAILSSRKKID